MNLSGLHDRLNAAVGERTYRHIGDLTNTHPETVRRYMHGQSPSIEFVAALAGALGLSGDWILTGRGPMKIEDAKAHHLQQSTAGDLLGAMAGNLERLIDRVDRLEQYTQVLETRLRATPLASTDHDQSPAASNPAQRAQHLADALAQRPSPHAR